jgi:AcrR family transcriptional regulator
MADSQVTQPAARRPGGRTARVREQILDATVNLVARHGIGGLRYDEVAELAGVNKTSVYRNWPDREKLVSEALIRFGEDAVPLADTGDLRRDLVDFLVALAAIMTTSTGRAFMAVVQTARENAEVQRTINMVFEQRVTAVRRRVDRSVERGELPAVDAYFFGEMLTGPLHLYIIRGFRPFTREEAEQITDVVLAGVRAAY